jgi:hypothetical protein
MASVGEQESVVTSQRWFDSAFIRAYEEGMAQRTRWQASVQQALRALWGLDDNLPVDANAIPSAAEIRALIGSYLPYEVKLSELIIREREDHV